MNGEHESTQFAPKRMEGFTYKTAHMFRHNVCGLFIPLYLFLLRSLRLDVCLSNYKHLTAFAYLTRLSST